MKLRPKGPRTARGTPHQPHSRSMRRIASFVLGLSAIGTQAMAQAAGPVLTLQEAVDLAVRNNPTYLQSTTGRTRAGAAVRSAYGNLLPNVNTSFGSSYREGRQQFFAGQAFGSTSDVLSSSSDVSVNAQYSRQSFLGIKQQKANLEAAEADVTNAAAQLRMNVITQYLNVLQAQARLPQDAATDQHQRDAENQRRRCLHAGMAVGVRLVGGMGALPTGIDEVILGGQVSNLVQAVGDQRLRMGQPADDELGNGEQQVDHHTDPGRPLRLCRPVCHRCCAALPVLHHVLCPILSAGDFSSWTPWES